MNDLRPDPIQNLIELRLRNIWIIGFEHGPDLPSKEAVDLLLGDAGVIYLEAGGGGLWGHKLALYHSLSCSGISFQIRSKIWLNCVFGMFGSGSVD